MSEIKEIAELWDRKWQREEINIFSQIEECRDNWTKHHFPFIDTKLSRMAEDKDAIFLEAGCGLGQWCIYATQKYGIKSIGVDIAINTIERLKKYVKENNLKNIEFIKDDLRETKLPSDTFDFFICLGVIEHFYNSKIIVDNLYRVTKRGGEGLISVPNLYSIHTITRPLARLLNRWEIGYEKSFSPKRLKDLVEKSGFKVIHFGVIPSGEMFGCTLNNIPLFGRLFNKLSYLIERHQKILGFISYVWVKKEKI